MPVPNQLDQEHKPLGDGPPATMAGADDMPGTVASAASSTRPDPLAVLRPIVEAARALMHADAAAILLHERERGLFVPVASVGLDERWLQGQGLEATRAFAARVLDARDPVAVRDTALLPPYDFPPLVDGRRPGAVCVAPLLTDGCVMGVLGIYDARPRTTPFDGEALRGCATLAAVAIASTRAHERERALRRRLEALDEASRALAGELALDQVLQRIVEAAARMAGARYGALGVAGPDGYLTDFITTGLSPEERAAMGPLPRGHGLLGVLVRQGQSLRVPDIARDPRRVGFPPHHPPMTNLLGVPIRSRGAVVGDLYLTDKIGAAEFTDDDQRVVEMLAAHAGIAIENARLYAEVRRLTQDRERERIARDLHDGIIQDLYAATLQIEDAAEDVPAEAVRERLLGVADRVSAVIADVRTYIQGLRARELKGRLLSEGLALLVRETDGRGGLRATYAVEGAPYHLPDETANALLQIAREALSNVVKHAGATEAHVRLAYGAEGVALTVEDNGRGFDTAAARGGSIAACAT